MNASELTFGVEIECIIPTANAPRCGGYHCGTQIDGLPAGWNAQRDGSINAESGYTAVEVVSGVLKGADGVRQIKTVLEWLNANGAKVNRSTGLHVHVGFDRRDRKALRRLVTIVANFEKAIYASTGTKSREQGSYCRSVQNDHSYQTAFRHSQVGSRAANADRTDRYHVLNVVSPNPTVEFRAFAGTLNFDKLISHVRTCLGIVSKCLKINRMPTWTAKPTSATSPIHRSGEGMTALTRLFYWLGWTKGRESVTFGIESEEGPSLTTMKRTLIRLAKKYDGATE